MDNLNKSSRELYNKLSKSSQDAYDRAISFLTSDYAKVLGKNAIITILSLILIGGASLAGARGIDKLQKNIDYNMIQKSQLSRIADLILTAARDGVEPTRADKKQGVAMARAMILDILSRLGGKYSSEPTSGMGLKGKGFNDDFKQKFKEASKKVYDAITSDEAKLLGKNALVTIILATMGYGASKLIKGKQMGELQKTAQDIDHDIKIRDLELQSKLKESIQNEEFNKIAQAMIDKNQREKEKAMYKMVADLQAHKAHMKTKYPVEYGAESEESDPEEEEYYEVQTTNPAIAQPTVAKGLKGGKWTAQNIKDYLHKVVTSKEAKILGATALASLILAGLGITGYMVAKNRNNIDNDFIKSQRNVAKLKAVLKAAKDKHVMSTPKASDIIDILEDELEAQMRQSTIPESFEEEEEEQIHKINIPLSTLATNKTIAELEEMYNKIESNTMTKPVAKKMASDLVDSIISTEVKNVASGRGMKGKGFSEDAKKIKNNIYKAITSQKGKIISASVLSTLILSALGAMGYHKIKSHEDKLSTIGENAYNISRSKKFIKELESEWEPEYKEGERASHFTIGEGLKSNNQKGLEQASKKITDLIQYARDLNLDKAALFSLITFLLGGVGYGGFKYIKGKARESEPIGYIPEDDVRQALEDYATGKASLSENIRADTKSTNLPWSGIGLKKKIKGGDLSKFGEYAKKKEEAEKKAKPIAKQITDWLYSDEAKIIGKAAIQYSILAALGMLTAYAGKKVGEKAISAIPKDRSKVNDPEGIMRGLNAPTGDIEGVKELQRQKGTDTKIRTAWKADPTVKNEDPISLSMPQRGRIVSPEILNLRRFALENPKNEAVQKYLTELGYTTPYSEDIMRMDPALAALFNIKATKEQKEMMKNYTGPVGDYYINPEDRRGPTKKISYAEGYKGIKEFLKKSTPTLGDAKKKEEESKEDFKQLKEFIDNNLPKEAGSDIDVAIKALEEVEQNRPNLTPSIITGAVSGVKDIAKRFSGSPQGSLTFSKPKVAEAKVERPTDAPKKERKQRHSLSRIIAEVGAHESSEEEGESSEEEGESSKEEGYRGDGFKENLNDFGKASAKKINEVGNAIYKVISSNEVKGVAGGVTAGLIVSILSMLMHEKRQETLAARREAARRPARPRAPAPNRPAPPPPSRGDSEFNPFANQ